VRQYVKVGEKARLLVAVGRKESNPVGITRSSLQAIRACGEVV